MAEEREVTVDDVLAVAPTPRLTAERIAQYANLRAEGLTCYEALERVGMSMATGSRYERWAALIRENLGFPPLRSGSGIDSYSLEHASQAGRSGAHQSNHVRRGITSPDCPLCTGSAS
jgi:hypothetical protein